MILEAARYLDHDPVQILTSADVVSVGSTVSYATDVQQDVTVQIQVEAGWHINANVPSDENLIPTDLLSRTGDGVLTASYPEGSNFRADFTSLTTTVYDGSVEIVATVAPSVGSSSYYLRVQACNEIQCLLPSDIPLILEDSP